ncbi:MAG: hypothetical protein ABIO05_08565 [Ferruginibacter sp.]
MASKKYNLLLAVFVLLATGTFAQTTPSGSGYDVYDSSVIRKRDMPQQNEFWNNSPNANFPAKPRNMWEIGISGGTFNVIGDVATQLSPGFAVHVRKALGYVVSLRLQYLYGIGKGQSALASENYGKNTAWNTKYSAVTRLNNGSLGTSIPGTPAEEIYYNYKNTTHDISLQGIVTVNNIRFHKNRSKFLLYGGGGIGASFYNVNVNALNDNGGNYSTIFQQAFAMPQTYEGRKDIRKFLKDNMDNSYETPAQAQGERRPSTGKYTQRLSTTILAGMAYRLSKRINLALENRHSFTKDDLLDGQQWQEHAYGDAVLTPNWDSYNYLSLGLNLNIGSKRVEPLYWINPLDYAYSELNNPRHMKLPKPIFDDADGDGVVDQLDREPNTPADCPVDTHGVTKDTDGDGVPDCKDKQLITPTECQPVDADGVGKCPEPDCCKNPPAPAAAACPCDYPSLSFTGNSLTINSDGRAMLATTSSKMKASPDCNITINGYPEASKASQATCQRRMDAAKKYLVETQGISADRITTNCTVGGGDKNTVDIKCQ